jgi:alginate O-acetyltransferase complex protein AlgI
LENSAKVFKRFILGFCKKVLLANNLAYVADTAFNQVDSDRALFTAWLGALGYALQIFFDFSAYSDMAIGLGKMFGFEFFENFNYPYISKSVSEFWRRWHMSLGEWFRDYVYFPLGGSRVKTKLRLAFNLFVVWVFTGFWHGASWNFILWGLLYFVLIDFEKFTGYPKKFLYSWQKNLWQMVSMLFVLFGWVLFRAVNLQKAGLYYASMVNITWGGG